MMYSLIKDYFRSGWIPAIVTWVSVIFIPILPLKVWFFILFMEFVASLYKLITGRFEAWGLSSMMFVVSLGMFGFVRLYQN